MDNDTSTQPIEELVNQDPTWDDLTRTHPMGSGFAALDGLTGGMLGQYRLVREVGQGSMGRVYEGVHQGLHRRCAIKVMNPTLALEQPHILENFWAEARAVATLLHPHVVTIYNLGSDQGLHYLEMEFVPGGESLKHRVVRLGPLGPGRAVLWTRQVVQALGAAHKSGLVHRDVKPSNVLITPEDYAKLADFGLVRSWTRSRPAKPGSEQARVPGGTVGGTPAFMAPELYQGADASPQSDIYAVGVTLYYMLTSRLPFTSTKMTELARLHARGEIPDLRDEVEGWDESLDSILRRCLAKKPEDRFASAEELSAGLQSALFHLRDIEDLVKESTEGLDALVQGGRGRSRIICRVPGDRVQEVYVETSSKRNGERVLTVFSLCCPADASHFEFALRLNAELTHGGVSIHEFGGQPMFVMSRTFALKRVAPADVRAAIWEIAENADSVENLLTGADLF
jgi:serine/threonine protein kinase